MIKMQPDMTETMEINHFHSRLRKNALQTFHNINSANKQTLEGLLAGNILNLNPRQLPNTNGLNQYLTQLP